MLILPHFLLLPSSALAGRINFLFLLSWSRIGRRKIRYHQFICRQD